MEVYETDLMLTHAHLRGKLNCIHGAMSVQQHLCELRPRTAIFSKPDEHIFILMKIIRLVKNKS